MGVSGLSIWPQFPTSDWQGSPGERQPVWAAEAEAEGPSQRSSSPLSGPVFPALAHGALVWTVSTLSPACLAGGALWAQAVCGGERGPLGGCCVNLVLRTHSSHREQKPLLEYHASHWPRVDASCSLVALGPSLIGGEMWRHDNTRRKGVGFPCDPASPSITQLGPDIL